jgi:hypothetical protein
VVVGTVVVGRSVEDFQEIRGRRYRVVRSVVRRRPVADFEEFVAVR